MTVFDDLKCVISKCNNVVVMNAELISVMSGAAAFCSEHYKGVMCVEGYHITKNDLEMYLCSECIPFDVSNDSEEDECLNGTVFAWMKSEVSACRFVSDLAQLLLTFERNSIEYCLGRYPEEVYCEGDILKLSIFGSELYLKSKIDDRVSGNKQN